jgi:hypothetical protein
MFVFEDSFEASYSKSEAAGFKYDLPSRDTISLQFTGQLCVYASAGNYSVYI